MRIIERENGTLHASGVRMLGVIAGPYIYVSRKPTPAIAAALADQWPTLRVVVAPRRVITLRGGAL